MNEQSGSDITAPDLGGQIKDLTEQIRVLEEGFNSGIAEEIESLEEEVREVRDRIQSRAWEADGPEKGSDRLDHAELGRIRKKEKRRLEKETDDLLKEISEGSNSETRRRVQAYRDQLERESRGNIFDVLRVFNPEVLKLKTSIASKVPTTTLKKLETFELTLGDFYRNYDYELKRNRL